MPSASRSLARASTAPTKCEPAELQRSSLKITDDAAAARWPDNLHRHRADPDRRGQPARLHARCSARASWSARPCRAGAIVVFESTVYPGVTEEICGPALEKASGLKCGVDFTLGYSPERINPGDQEHPLEKIIKVVAGQDAETLDRLSADLRRDRRGRHPRGAVDQGRRGRQGHREHPARRQHRADERGLENLRPGRHPLSATCSLRPARSGIS